MRLTMLGNDYRYGFAPVGMGRGRVEFLGGGLSGSEVPEDDVRRYLAIQGTKGRTLTYEQAEAELVDKIGVDLEKGLSVASSISNILGSVSNNLLEWYKATQETTGKTVIKSSDLKPNPLLSYAPWSIGGGLGIVALALFLRRR